MSDESAIIDLHQQFAAAWSHGDLETLLGMFTEDATRVGVSGDVQHGRGELRAAFTRMFGGAFQGAQVKLERGTVRPLGSQYALWQAPIEIVPSGGKPGIRGYSVDVMQKVGSSWKILETHPMFFPPPPR